MSTSLLYHAFGVRGHRYVRSEYLAGGVVFSIQQDREHLSCPACGTSAVILRGRTDRRFLAPPIGGKPVTIAFSVPRIECLSCGVVRQVEVGFAKPRRQHTRSFERYVLELSRFMTILDVARHLGVGWDLVKDLQKQDLTRRYQKPRLKDLRLLAIDEIAVRKGQRYMTVVLDLETGVVVHVEEGCTSRTLDPFWRRLRSSGARVEAVAIDLSAAYVKALRKNLPRAVMVFDRFHVVKLMNEKLSKLRRVVQGTAEKEERKVLKGTRWLLVKKPENLDEDRGEKERLETALRLNAPLAAAYYLKEDLRLFWEQDNKVKAEEYFDEWLERARASEIPIRLTLVIYLSDGFGKSGI